MPTFVLSPHPDGAVLSCWRLLTALDDAHVINVFTAPPDASRLAWWDRLTGAVDGAARMSERLIEDEQALARAGQRGQLRREVQVLDDDALIAKVTAVRTYRTGVLAEHNELRVRLREVLEALEDAVRRARPSPALSW